MGRDQPIVAVDDVDLGSVPALAVGASLPISSVQAEPRQAEIVGAFRDHRRTYRLWRHGGFSGRFALLRMLAPRARRPPHVGPNFTTLVPAGRPKPRYI